MILLGLAYHKRIQVGVVDMGALGLRGPDIARILAEERPYIIGISSLVVNHKNGMQIAGNIPLRHWI